MSRTEPFDAAVLDTPDFFVGNAARLVIVDRDRHAVLLATGEWQVEDPAGEPVVNDRIGIVLPRLAFPAIAEAIARWGGAGDARTEARVLREWLAAERARLDATLDRSQR